MPKKTLTARTIASLKPAPAGKKYDVQDSIVPGLAVRVSETGSKSFILIKRQPGDTHPTRRTIAKVGVMELQKARATARLWLEQIAAGIDPEAAKATPRNNIFEAVAEAYIAAKIVGRQKKADDIARTIRREFGGVVHGRPVGPWAGRPIEAITPADVADLIMAKAKTAPAQAHGVLHYIKRLFDWAVVTGKIKFSPAAPVRPNILLDPLVPRSRRLSNAELTRIWRAADELGYPLGDAYRLLILTGLRLNEVCDAEWSEFDFEEGLWLIPARRMKQKTGTQQRAHAVPIVPDIMKLLDRLPRRGRRFLFSTGDGGKPLWIADHWKGVMDKKARVYDWINHDIRRTVRSNLSEIPTIPEHVREAVLAHKRTGVAKVYDVSEYLDEKSHALKAWHARLRSIVDPPDGNVVPLHRAS